MKEVGLGIVGFGGIARIHGIALNSMNLVFNDLKLKPRLKWVCRRNSNDEVDLFEKVTDDLSVLIEYEEIEGIDVCTPNFLHLEQGKEIISEGKNIYMEKPLGKDLTEAEELTKLCEQEEVINQVGFKYRFMPAVVLARDYIQEGSLGEILNFRVALYHNSYLNSERPMSWRLRKDLAGGGALMDLGIHMADVVRFLLGGVKDVQARTNTYFKERYESPRREKKVKAEADEWALLNINLENGGYGTLEVSRISADIEEKTIIEIYGTNGKIKVTTEKPDYPEIYLHEHGQLFRGEMARTSDYSKYHKTIYPSYKFDLGWFVNAHLASLLNFMKNIKAGRIKYEETPTFEEACESQKIIEMGYISAEEGNRVVKREEMN